LESFDLRLLLLLLLLELAFFLHFLNFRRLQVFFKLLQIVFSVHLLVDLLLLLLLSRCLLLFCLLPLFLFVLDNNRHLSALLLESYKSFMLGLDALLVFSLFLLELPQELLRVLQFDV